MRYRLLGKTGVRISEGALGTMTFGDDWGWGHDDKDGPNGPSHGRASVAGAHVLIPLQDGRPALGRYQAVFLCEFDGPKTRSVYVTVIQ